MKREYQIPSPPRNHPNPMAWAWEYMDKAQAAPESAWRTVSCPVCKGKGKGCDYCEGVGKILSLIPQLIK